MINIFLIVSGIIGLILILIILFQKTEGGSLGLGTQTSLTGGMTSNKSTMGMRDDDCSGVGIFHCVLFDSIGCEFQHSSLRCLFFF